MLTIVMERHVSATHFKAHCLRLLDEVSEMGDVLVVTKHSKPIARVIPAKQAGSLRGSGRQVVSDDELIAPLDELWEANA
jgi:prevent-host-death family protein